MNKGVILEGKPAREEIPLFFVDEDVVSHLSDVSKKKKKKKKKKG